MNKLSILLLPLLLILTACNKFEEGERVFVDLPGSTITRDAYVEGKVIFEEKGEVLVKVTKSGKMKTIDIDSNATFDDYNGFTDFFKMLPDSEFLDGYKLDELKGEEIYVPVAQVMPKSDGKKYWKAKQSALKTWLEITYKAGGEAWRVRERKLKKVVAFVDEYHHLELSALLELVELQLKAYGELKKGNGFEKLCNKKGQQLPWLQKTGDFYREMPAFLEKHHNFIDTWKSGETLLHKQLFLIWLGDEECIQNLVRVKNPEMKINPLSFDEMIKSGHPLIRTVSWAHTLRKAEDFVDIETVVAEKREEIYSKFVGYYLFKLGEKLESTPELTKQFKSVDDAISAFEKDKEAAAELEELSDVEIYTEEIKQKWYVRPVEQRLADEEANADLISEHKMIQQKADDFTAEYKKYTAMYKKNSQSSDFPARAVNDKLSSMRSDIKELTGRLKYIKPQLNDVYRQDALEYINAIEKEIEDTEQLISEYATKPKSEALTEALVTELPLEMTVPKALTEEHQASDEDKPVTTTDNSIITSDKSVVDSELMSEITPAATAIVQENSTSIEPLTTEQKIAQLKTQAMANIKEYKLQSPKANNASGKLQQIRDLSPNAAEATEVEQAIAKAYYNLANSAAKKGQISKAKSQLASAKKFNLNTSLAKSTEQAIEQAQIQQQNAESSAAEPQQPTEMVSVEQEPKEEPAPVAKQTETKKPEKACVQTMTNNCTAKSTGRSIGEDFDSIKDALGF